jgi:hypothetical protein
MTDTRFKYLLEATDSQSGDIFKLRLDPNFGLIKDPGSRIQQQQKREAEKFVVLPFSVATPNFIFKQLKIKI